MRKNVQIYPIPGREARKVLDMRGGQTTRRSAAADAFTAGMILGWSGAIADIPTGWALCDGSAGTPDLRGKFIVGYKSGDADYGTQGATGGYAGHGGGVNDHLPHLVNHTHGVVTDDAVVQTLPDSCINNPPGNGVERITFVTGLEHPLKCEMVLSEWCDDVQDPAEERAIEAGDGARLLAGHSSTDNRPPYYVLAFIVKL